MSFIKKYLDKRRELAKFRNASTEEVFSYIHESNKWGDMESRSGKGSSLEKTERIRGALPQLLTDLQVSSLLDIPCGDFFWMKEVTLPLEVYIGADIIDELVLENRRLYSDGQRSFQKLNLLEDTLPPADAILCRDCLVHFSFADIARAIDNIKSSGATWFLTTHYPQQIRNTDIVTGKHRPLNLMQPPFNWPAPWRDLLEYDNGRHLGMKHLSVWRIAALP